MSEPKHSEPAPDDLGFELPAPPKVGKSRITLFLIIAVVVIAGLFAAGLIPRLLKKHSLEAEARGEADELPRVEVTLAKALTSDRAMVLPGNVQPLEETVLYPRTSGYVKKWNVDLGADVKEGDVLMEIDTPELDAQLEQGRARLAEAEAGVLRAQSAQQFSTTTADRYKSLTPAGIASQQELEQRQGQADVDTASVGVAKANVAAAQANLRQLQQTKLFAKVVAPFSGRVVQRWVERGMLVQAGTANPLFKLENTDPVRIFINVPQDVAPSVRAGSKADANVREYPDRAFDGTVAHLAGSLDSASRTMRTEVQVPNADHALFSGMYVQVSLTLPTPHRLLEVPATALYTDAKGTQLAVVDGSNVVSMKKIVIERDTGQTLQISSGLTGDERIVKLANAALKDGSRVQLLEPKKPEVAPSK